MTIDTNTVKKVAKLARIRISEAEAERYAGELGSIFGWVEQLTKVNTDGVEPMAGVGGYTLRMREDVITEGNAPERVLANAPQADYGCFIVPKVVE